MKRKSANNISTSSVFAGLGSGAISSVVCAPLDLIRTRVQVMGNSRPISYNNMYRSLKEIFHQEGFRGCFRGLGVSFATVPTFWGIYFPIYELTKRNLSVMQHKQQHHNGFPAKLLNNVSFIHMTSAITAGGIADVLCNPMFVIRTRMQTERLHNKYLPQQSILSTMVSIYREGGLPVFWRGLSASLFGLSHVAIQFPVYEWCKAQARSRSSSDTENSFDLLIASALSKTCACLVTYPHEVIRSRVMDSRCSVTLIDTVKSVIAKEGYIGLYSGLTVSLVRVIPNCCVTFVSYELMLRSLSNI